MAKSKVKRQNIPNLPSIRTDKEVLFTGIFTFVSLAGMMIWALLVPLSDPDEYSGVHHALFTLCLLNIIFFIIVKGTLLSTAMLFYKALKKQEKVYKGDIGLLLHFVAILLIPVAIMFILDLSFIASYGIKLSVTTIVMLLLGIVEYVKDRLYKAKSS